MSRRLAPATELTGHDRERDRHTLVDRLNWATLETALRRRGGGAAGG